MGTWLANNFDAPSSPSASQSPRMFPRLAPPAMPPGTFGYGGNGQTTPAPRVRMQSEHVMSKSASSGVQTAICFRNIPNDFSTKMVLDLLNQMGFGKSYDFVYVPHDFKRLPARVNVGYFFVNV